MVRTDGMGFLSTTLPESNFLLRRFPEQKLSRAQALKGMTLDPAYASFNEHELGSITIGKKADFVVLDQDIMSVPQGEILKTKVVTTIIDGQSVYGRL